VDKHETKPNLHRSGFSDGSDIVIWDQGWSSGRQWKLKKRKKIDHLRQPFAGGQERNG